MKETRPHRKTRLPSVRITVSRGTDGLAVAVNDAPALKVIGRELDLDPVARVDPDPESPHLAGGVAKRLVTVVERDPELAVTERLDDLPFELDLLFFRRNDCPLSSITSTAKVPVPG
jgi:hypothetical protein